MYICVCVYIYSVCMEENEDCGAKGRLSVYTRTQPHGNFIGSVMRVRHIYTCMCVYIHIYTDIYVVYVYKRQRIAGPRGG